MNFIPIYVRVSMFQLYTLNLHFDGLQKKRKRRTSDWTSLLEETMVFHEVFIEENPTSQLV